MGQGKLHVEKKLHEQSTPGCRLLPQLAITAMASSNDAQADMSWLHGTLHGLVQSQVALLRKLQGQQPEFLLRHLTDEELRRLAPERVLKYVCPEASFDREESIRVASSLVR